LRAARPRATASSKRGDFAPSRRQPGRSMGRRGRCSAVSMRRSAGGRARDVSARGADASHASQSLANRRTKCSYPAQVAPGMTTRQDLQRKRGALTSCAERNNPQQQGDLAALHKSTGTVAGSAGIRRAPPPAIKSRSPSPPAPPQRRPAAASGSASLRRNGRSGGQGGGLQKGSRGAWVAAC
jgi:hypothetical protein